MDEIERTGFLADGLEGASSSGVGVGGRCVRRGFSVAALDFVGEGDLFKAPEAHLTPAGYRHVFDEELFGETFGLVLFDEAFEEIVEATTVFAFEDDGGGEEAMTGGVAGGAGLTGNCTGTRTF